VISTKKSFFLKKERITAENIRCLNRQLVFLEVNLKNIISQAGEVHLVQESGIYT
jgi:hypothetical protein